MLICDRVSFSLNDVAMFIAEYWLEQGQITCVSEKRQSFPVRATQIRIRGCRRTSRYGAASGRSGSRRYARHSVLSWPTPFDINLMTGQSPSWKRHTYYEILWKKSVGANLRMLP